MEWQVIEFQIPGRVSPEGGEESAVVSTHLRVCSGMDWFRYRVLESVWDVCVCVSPCVHARVCVSPCVHAHVCVGFSGLF